MHDSRYYNLVCEDGTSNYVRGPAGPSGGSCSVSGYYVNCDNGSSSYVRGPQGERGLQGPAGPGMDLDSCRYIVSGVDGPHPISVFSGGRRFTEVILSCAPGEFLLQGGCRIGTDMRTDLYTPMNHEEVSGPCSSAILRESNQGGAVSCNGLSDPQSFLRSWYCYSSTLIWFDGYGLVNHAGWVQAYAVCCDAS